MRLYILRPKDGLPEDDNPWKPWYDKCFGFIVRANNEKEAREFADADAGDENRGEFGGRKRANTNNPWLDEKYSSCDELSAGGGAGIVMKDFASA